MQIDITLANDFIRQGEFLKALPLHLQRRHFSVQPLTGAQLRQLLTQLPIALGDDLQLRGHLACPLLNAEQIKQRLQLIGTQPLGIDIGL